MTEHRTTRHRLTRHRSAAVAAALLVSALLLLAGCSVGSPRTPDDPVEGREMTETLYVGPELADCEGVEPRQCLLVRRDPQADWELFYDDIGGFDWEPGFVYQLRVEVGEREDTPADASARSYRLVEVVEKRRA